MGSVPEEGLALEGGKTTWWLYCPEMLLFAREVTGHLAMPVRIYLDSWNNAASRGYEDRPKPSLLVFSPF